MTVTDEGTDVTELLWAVVTVDTDSWDVFCETFAILGVDLKVAEVVFVETTGVITLDVAMGFEVVAVPLFEVEESLFSDDFPEGFKVVVVTFLGETEAVDGFTLTLEDSCLWLGCPCWSPWLLPLEFCTD